MKIIEIWYNVCLWYDCVLHGILSYIFGENNGMQSSHFAYGKLAELKVCIWFDCYKYFDDIIEFKNQSWPTFHRINLAIRSQVNKLNSAWIFPFIMYVYSRPLTVPNLCGFYLYAACFIVLTALFTFLLTHDHYFVWLLQYWQSAESLDLLLRSVQLGDNLTICF